MIRVATVMLVLVVSPFAWAKDIAICGESEGYVYFPKSGLLADQKEKDTGKWLADGIKAGRFTLSKVDDKFDLHRHYRHRRISHG